MVGSLVLRGESEGEACCFFFFFGGAFIGLGVDEVVVSALEGLAEKARTGDSSSS